MAVSETPLGLALKTQADSASALKVIHGLALCAGSGMFEEGIGAALRVLGFEHRTICFVERDSSAAAFLVARMEAKALEQALVWDDLSTFDGRPFRGKIALISAGLPCQPYSSAGKRRGNTDERSHGDGDGPLPHTIRIIDAVRPALVQFENVPEWVTGGYFREFGEQLCDLGYDIAPPLFVAAKDVGAPHERERVYIQCRLVDGVELGDGERCGFETNDHQPDAPEPAGPIDELGDGSGARCSSAWSWQSAESERRDGVPSLGRDRIPMFPPGRNDYRRWAALVAGGLDPACMPAIERGVQHVAHGVPFSAADLLRLSGNSVVPLAAGAAFAILFRGWR